MKAMNSKQLIEALENSLSYINEPSKSAVEKHIKKLKDLTNRK